MGRTAAVAVAVISLAIGTARADGWRVTDRARTASMPWSVRVSPDGSTLWVAIVGRRDRETVWRFDAATLEVRAKTGFEGHAVETELLDGGKRLLVSNSREDKMMILDAEDLSVERAIAVGRVPKDFDVTSDDKTAYIANWGGNSVSVLDIASGKTREIATGRHARGATLSPDESEVYVMNFGAGTIAVVDTKTEKVTDRIRACKNPRHAVAAGERLLVTCFGQRHVLVIDRASREIERKLKVGRGPKTIALAPDASFAVTANEKADSVSFIDLATWEVETVDVDARKPCGAAVSPDGGKVYVTARGSHELIVLARDPD